MRMLKAEVKLGFSKELFESFEDDRLKAVEEQYRFLGGEKALHQARVDVEKLMGLVERDVEEQKWGLEQGALCKRYIDRCMQILFNLAEQKRLSALIAKGRVDALQDVTTRLKKVAQIESTKLQNLMEASEIDPPLDRPVGGHPGKSLKEQRLAEDATMASAQPDPLPTEGLQQPSTTDPEAPSNAVVEAELSVDLPAKKPRRQPSREKGS